MEDFQLLQKLFDGKLIKTELNEYNKSCIELKEKEYSVIISNIPESAVAIKTDKFQDLGCFFNCSEDIGQCKRADFVIVTDDKLIFIELCRGTKSEKEIVQQLKGGQCVIEYCRSISAKFYNYDSLLKDHSPYFVSISNIAPVKKGSFNTSKGKNKAVNKKNDKPDKFLKINAPHNLQFNALCHTR